MRAIKERKTGKRTGARLAALLSALVLSLLPIGAAKNVEAAVQPDYTQKCSLYIESSKDVAVDASFTVWKVADWKEAADETGSFTVVDALGKEAAGLDLSALNTADADANAKTAKTVYNVVASTSALKPVASKIDIKAANGEKAALAEGLEAGLYLIYGAGNDGTVMSPVLVSLPLYDEVSGFWGYEVTIEATKFSAPQPADKLSVRKVWKGDSEKDRPVSITVVIKNKTTNVQKEIKLTKEANWAADVTLSDFQVKRFGNVTDWAVSEKVTSGYTQGISNKVSTGTDGSQVCVYTITNTKAKPLTPNTPRTTNNVQTGDPTHMTWLVLIFAVSGVVLVILGVNLMKQRKEER